MKQVLYSSPFVPAEWISAHGLVPQRLEPGAGGRMQAAAEGVCPFAWRFAAEAQAAAECPVVFATTCDQMRRLSERTSGSRPAVFLLNVPATWQSPTALRLYADELRRLGRFLVACGGTAPSVQALAGALAAADAARRGLGGAGEWPRAGGSRGTGTVPVALVGGPLAASQRLTLQAIEENGGRVVLDATEDGERGWPARLDRRRLKEEPFETMAEAYFSIPDVFQRPDSRLHEYLKREVAGAGAAGVVLVRQTWCDLWGAQVRPLRDGLDVPVLDLVLPEPGEWDAAAPGRIQAFLEVLR